MKSYLKIAWRNIWRNKRRTLITMASVFFAVLMALLMRSMQLGSYSRMVENVVEFYHGYIQVHKAGYWEDKSIDESFSLDAEMEATVANQPGVKGVIPRLESFALASYEEKSKGVMVVGTRPEAESQLTHLENRLIRGEYIKKKGKGVLVAEDLAEFLKLNVGDTLVMIGQGYHGVSAFGKYPVRGVVRFASPELNKRMVFLPLEEAWYFYAAPEKLTSLVIMPEKVKDVASIQSGLKEKLGADYEVMDWQELLPEMVQQIKGDNAQGVFMLAILYLIIGFGIFGTILMMTAERKKEFGVMVAVGMHREWLSWVVTLETLLLTFLGLLAGVIAGIPVIGYLFNHPIPLQGELKEAMISYGFEPVMPFAFESGFFINQFLVVLLITLMAGAYPILRILWLNPVKAMK